MWVEPSEVFIFTRPFSKLSVPIFLFVVNYRPTFRNIPINNNELFYYCIVEKKNKDEY